MNNTTTAAVIAAAKASPMMTYSWKGRGEAPPGYTVGMAVAFGTLYEDLKAGLDYALRMAAQAGLASDALAWYAGQFPGGVATKPEDRFRQLFVLLTGLGMRESSGRYCEGRDTSANNKGSDTAEAGLFQMSWDARMASPLIPALFQKWQTSPGDGMIEIFKQGVTPESGELFNWGGGDGKEFQRMCKAYPYFAVLTAAVGLRVLRSHWGPINNRAAQIVPELDVLYKKVQAIVDAGVGAGPLPPADPEPPVHDLRWAQAALNKLGYGAVRGDLVVDGVKGPKTKAALEDFQMAVGIAADGLYGTVARGALESALSHPGQPPQAAVTPPTSNPFYGKVYRYLIGAEVLPTGNTDEILEVPWDTDRKPLVGIAVHYRNLLDENYDAATGTGDYGPYLKGDDVAEEYGEGQIDPNGPMWMKNILDQLQVSSTLGFKFVEWDNPDAKGQKIIPDVMKALDASHALSIGVVAKNANKTDAPITYLGHVSVVAHVIERNCGTPETADKQRILVGKPLLPTVFVFFGNTLAQAQACARQIKMMGLKGMSVTHSPDGEYTTCAVVLAPSV